MARETLEIPDDLIASSPSEDDRSPSDSSDPSLSRTVSSSRLNARAPEFVPGMDLQLPRMVHASNRMDPQQPRMVQIHHGPPPPPMIHIFHPPPSSPFHAPVVQNHSSFEYYGGGGGLGEPEVVHTPLEPELAPGPAPAARDGLPEEVTQKITKQVEYYFSDINLATTEHLMRFICKDPEGFVPISVIASFKKIKALVNNNSLLATALRTSSKLVVSDDGKKVRRLQPFTDPDMDELQSRIVVAENLPEDHCYQNLFKVFSIIGSVKTIRTCYPQTPNGMASAPSRCGKLDIFPLNKLHAFVEYETVELAEKAVAELNDERNWRSGLRVRLLPRCMHPQNRGKRGGHEGEGNGEEEDVSTSNLPKEKHPDDPRQPIDASHEHLGEEGHNDKEGGVKRGKGRGRGGKGRGRGQYHNSNRSGGHAIGTPPSSHPIQIEQPAVTKQPPGPRMPDGTRGFTMGRGKPLGATSTVS